MDTALQPRLIVVGISRTFGPIRMEWCFATTTRYACVCLRANPNLQCRSPGDLHEPQQQCDCFSILLSCQLQFSYLCGKNRQMIGGKSYKHNTQCTAHKTRQQLHFCEKQMTQWHVNCLKHNFFAGDVGTLDLLNQVYWQTWRVQKWSTNWQGISFPAQNWDWQVDICLILTISDHPQLTTATATSKCSFPTQTKKGNRKS